jgi:hypothetical protein
MRLGYYNISETLQNDIRTRVLEAVAQRAAVGS